MNDKAHGNREEQAIDRELDAALAKYAAVEPRAGLDQRVLAGLRTERERRAAAAWWRWPATAAVAAALLVIVVAFAWRFKTPEQKLTNQHAPQTQIHEHESAKVASATGSREMHVEKKTSHRAVPGPHTVEPETVVASVPKLDQFPSRQPLSEQEKMLMRYVAEYPSEATLVAKLRAEDLRREREEEMADFPGSAGSEDLDQRVSEKVNR